MVKSPWQFERSHVVSHPGSPPAWLLGYFKSEDRAVVGVGCCNWSTLLEVPLTKGWLAASAICDRSQCNHGVNTQSVGSRRLTSLPSLLMSEQQQLSFHIQGITRVQLRSPSLVCCCVSVPNSSRLLHVTDFGCTTQRMSPRRVETALHCMQDCGEVQRHFLDGLPSFLEGFSRSWTATPDEVHWATNCTASTPLLCKTGVFGYPDSKVCIAPPHTHTHTHKEVNLVIKMCCELVWITCLTLRGSILCGGGFPEGGGQTVLALRHTLCTQHTLMVWTG